MREMRAKFSLGRFGSHGLAPNWFSVAIAYTHKQTQSLYLSVCVVGV